MNKYKMNLTFEELELLSAIMAETAKQYKDVRIQMLYRKVFAKKEVCKTLEERTPA